MIVRVRLLPDQADAGAAIDGIGFGAVRPFERWRQQRLCREWADIGAARSGNFVLSGMGPANQAPIGPFESSAPPYTFCGALAVTGKSVDCVSPPGTRCPHCRRPC